MNKKIIISTIIILLIGAGALYTSLNKSPETEPDQPVVIETTTEQPEVTQNTDKNITKSYSLSEVAEHKTENNCWTAIKGKVYNITSVIPTHPAGKEKIMKGCGIDATTIFSKVEQHDLDLLAPNIIGNLN